jgi:hypothetical protein
MFDNSLLDIMLKVSVAQAIILIIVLGSLALTLFRVISFSLGGTLMFGSIFIFYGWLILKLALDNS